MDASVQAFVVEVNEAGGLGGESPFYELVVDAAEAGGGGVRRMGEGVVDLIRGDAWPVPGREGGWVERYQSIQSQISWYW